MRRQLPLSGPEFFVGGEVLATCWPATEDVPVRAEDGDVLPISLVGW
jgi:hypothetical protein